jgi:hypothetical protein
MFHLAFLILINSCSGNLKLGYGSVCMILQNYSWKILIMKSTALSVVMPCSLQRERERERERYFRGI